MSTVYKELQKGRYKITKLIGQEQSVLFYQAFDKVLGKEVLLKEFLLNSNKTATPDQTEAVKQAFISRSIALMKIEHEGIVRVYDFFTEVEYKYLSIELVEGESLEEFLKSKNEPVAITDLLNWGEQLLESLKYLHNQSPQIIYSKVRPKNLLMTSDGKIKLLAMGLGRTSISKSIEDKASDSTNLHYLPLELIWERLDSASQRVIINSYEGESKQNLLKTPDVRTDIYGIGTTLYHLATGKAPIDALERSINLLENKPDPLQAPHLINPDIPLEISEVLMKAIEIKRENRFGTTAKMLAELVNTFSKYSEANVRKSDHKSVCTPVANISKQNLSAVKSEVKTFSVEQPLPKTDFIETKVEENANLQEILELPEEPTKVSETPLEIEKSAVTEEKVELKEKPKEILVEETTKDILEAEFLESNDSDQSEKDDFESLQRESDSDFKEMFAQPKKEKKTFRQRAAIVAVLLLLGFGTWGGMQFASSKAVKANTAAVQTQPLAETTPKEQTSESLPVETFDETIAADEEVQTETNENAEEPYPIQTTATPQTNGIQTVTVNVKNKPDVSKNPTKEKPQIAKTEKKKKVTVDDLITDVPEKKKKVTVDDLINDN